MSEQTNAEVIRQAYEAFGRGDIPEVLDLLTDDVDWALQGPSVIPWAGPGRGREAVAEFFSLLGENLEFERFEPRAFVAQGDTVVVLGDERSLVKPTGRTFENEWAHVYALRDGKIAKARFFEDTAAQVVAFGAAQEGGGGGRTSSDAASETTTAGTGVGPEAAAGQPTGA
jgi:ketosteroid isomerase-like protein